MLTVLTQDGGSMQRIAAALGADLARAVPSEAAVGGGGAPGVVIASAAVELPPLLADPLRAGDPPVVGHVSGGRLDDTIIAAVQAADRP